MWAAAYVSKPMVYVRVSGVPRYRHTHWASGSRRGSRALIAIDQLMTEMIICLSSLCFDVASDRCASVLSFSSKASVVGPA